MHLAKLDSEHVEVVDLVRVEFPYPIRVAKFSIFRRPATCTALGKANADQITMSMYWVMQPIEAVFSAAQDQVGRSVVHPGVLAGTLLAIINGMNLSPLGSDPARKTAAADGVLSLLIKGLLAG